MADQNGKGAPPGALPPSVRKVGPQSAEPVGSLAREDYLLAMPDPEFERWVDSRLSGAYGTPSEQDEFRAVEADRRLRAWARDGGELVGARKPLADLGSESPIEAMLLEAFFASGFFDRLEVPSDVVVGSGPSACSCSRSRCPASTSGTGSTSRSSTRRRACTWRSR
ncbi:MAG: hypothetical protein WDO74_10880 [Pseudomonadota bacterium]